MNPQSYTRLFQNTTDHEINDPQVGIVPAGGRVSISSRVPTYASIEGLVDITDLPGNAAPAQPAMPEAPQQPIINAQPYQPGVPQL